MPAMVRSLAAVVRGDPGDLSGRAVARTSLFLGIGSAVIANLGGAAVVVILLLFVLPNPEGVDRGAVALRNLTLAGPFALVATLHGSWISARRARRTLGWLVADREPTEAERQDTVGLARWSALRQSRWWLLGAVVFSVYNAGESLALAGQIAVTILIGGATTVAAVYLELERLLRAPVARALEGWGPERPSSSRVAARTLLAWGLGSALPVVGIAVLGGTALIGSRQDGDAVALAALVLAVIALVAGLWTMTLQVKSVAEPLSRLRDALARVEAGDLDVTVPVTDATEVGYLQAGFNQAIAGLRERDRVRDLFGRQVGQEVASRSLAGAIELGGEERLVGVLFVDVVGSTAFAEGAGPVGVVRMLNDFFAVVIDATLAHGGVVDKFEGDAALCIWGAPLGHADPAGGALAAAREMAAALEEADLPVTAAVGVSAGRVVAGNVGARDRFEYTVIGDPVNEAARLTELAKERPGRVLASGRAVDQAGDGEAVLWRSVGEQVLRGRSTPTRLMVPAAG